ncbi:MarR family winged helix-turn-helix transcriptional regulator [Caballeronia novacaledonica]|uniref:Winged helix-turn-helix transcriptional regulator n=1 Tax=Caballeronia novacaledonica TaxID=1544861 RepID=A0AA37IHK9_9BURK|nr:MarR family winged helix-turn-helix transcriptional regulator [Caballeronia novacaledonica]GJH29961.1 winged helix-turn-helix transcriptional regulator [Caballeronia novacaledonica]
MTTRQLPTSVCCYGALRRAVRGVGLLYDQALAPAGINAAQYNLLRSIEKLGSATQSELAAELVMDLSALGHTLKPLVRDGWVSLLRDADDGRRRLVTLTSDGRDKLHEAQQLWRPAQKRFETVLGEKDTQRLLKLLDHLASTDFSDAFLT